MSARKDPIKAAGSDKIAAAAEKAQKDIDAIASGVELSVCGGLKCHPLSMARKLAISRFMEVCPDADETEIALVSTYILSLPKENFWLTARNARTILSKAAAFADESDPSEFESLMNDAASKIAHLQETSSMQGDGGAGDDSGNGRRSPE
jgi:hypothetical protein